MSKFIICEHHVCFDTPSKIVFNCDSPNCADISPYVPENVAVLAFTFYWQTLRLFKDIPPPSQTVCRELNRRLRKQCLVTDTGVIVNPDNALSKARVVSLLCDDIESLTDVPPIEFDPINWFLICKKLDLVIPLFSD